FDVDPGRMCRGTGRESKERHRELVAEQPERCAVPEAGREIPLLHPGLQQPVDAAHRHAVPPVHELAELGAPLARGLRVPETLVQDTADGHGGRLALAAGVDRKSTRLNSSHVKISYAVFCLKKKKKA